MDFSFNGNKPENVLFNGNTVNKVLCNGVVVWEKSQSKYNIPFTITAIENTEIGMTHSRVLETTGTYIPQLEYSRNGIIWTAWDYNALSLNAGESLYFRGDNPNGIGQEAHAYSSFTIPNKVNISGNIMSLMYKYNFETNWVLTPNCFCELFYNTKIVNASELLLPATKLAGACYQQMFNGCTSLVTAPALPATELDQFCYSGMFWNCTSLVTAPELPATVLTNWCYSDMFEHCTSLVTPPVLPATVLADACYNRMFYGCTALTAAPKLPATTLNTACYGKMFWNCTSLVTAPELPATTLITGCYEEMFRYCEKLNYIKAMFTTTPSDSYTKNWVYGVSSTGKFVKNKNATWNVTGNNGIPSGWTIQNA